MRRKRFIRNGNPDATALFSALPHIPDGGASLRKIQMIVAGEGTHNIAVFHAIAKLLDATVEQITLLDTEPENTGSTTGTTAGATATKGRKLEVEFPGEELPTVLSHLAKCFECGVDEIKLKIIRTTP